MNFQESFYPYTICLTVLLTAVIFSIFRLRACHDTLSHIPGPTFSRWSNLWEVYYARTGRRSKAIHELHQRYGPFVRTSPTHVSISDKDVISVVYSQGLSVMEKSPFYDAFVSEKPSIFSTRDRTEHAQIRHFYSTSFSSKAVRSYGMIVQQVTQKLLAKLDQRAAGSDKGSVAPVVDLLMWMNYLSFDILSSLAFGESLGMVDKESDVLFDGSGHGAIGSIDDREHFLTVLGHSPFIKRIASYIPDPLFRRGSSSSTDLANIARTYIERRLESGIKREDILGHLIDAQKERSGEVAAKDLVSEAITLIVAGTDATANTMAVMIHLIMTYPPVHHKLRAELEHAYGKGNIPTSAEDDLNDLPYLHACVLETLRWHSPAAMGLPRVSNGFYFKGFWFPPGVDVSAPTWTLQHDPSIYGDDAYIFRPERWIEDPGLIRCFMAFSTGARACLGRGLALLEMKIVVATLIQRYEISPQVRGELETSEKFLLKPKEVLVTLKTIDGEK